MDDGNSSPQSCMAWNASASTEWTSTNPASWDALQTYLVVRNTKGAGYHYFIKPTQLRPTPFP
jgi:hypothetical protein